MIKIEQLCKEFQTDFWTKPFYALQDVSFEIPKSKIVGFLGANGAGKTTTLKIIMGFIKPTTGKVIFSDELKGHSGNYLDNIGYLPERPYFYPHLKGKEFLFLLGKLHGLEDIKLKSQIDKWSSRLKIDYALDRKIHNYSKGMLQRLGFVSCLLHEPKLVILDEPVSGLDPIGRKEIKDVIGEIWKEGKTVFFSSHIIPDVEEVCDTVVFLEKGKLVYEGSVDQIIYDHKSSNFTIRYRVIGQEQIQTSVIDGAAKDDFIFNAASNKFEIISLYQNKMSLEEIFYKVKGTERVSR